MPPRNMRASASIWISFGLVLLITGLLGYMAHSHKEMLELTEQSRASQRLSVLALLLSEANYHTQLELYEYVASRTEKHREDFDNHREKLRQRLAETEEALRQVPFAPIDAIEKLDKVKQGFPKIEQTWQQIITAIQEHRSDREIQHALQVSELTFDNIGVNEVIKELAEHQLEKVHNEEEFVQELDRLHSWTLVVGLFTSMLLSAAVLYLHRKALRNKLQHVQWERANRVAGLGQLAGGFAEQISAPFAMLKDSNHGLHAAIRGTQLESASTVTGHLQKMDQSLEQIAKILRQLHQLSYPEPVETTIVDVNQIARNAVTLLAEQLKTDGIEFSIEVPRYELTVRANASRLEQAVMNLIGHAQESLAKQTGAKTMSVRTALLGRHVQITVDFNGPGLGEDELPQIFAPSYSAKDHRDGAGFGLSIAHSILREFQGRLQIEKSDQTGTCFAIRIPLAVHSQTG